MTTSAQVLSNTADKTEMLAHLSLTCDVTLVRPMSAFIADLHAPPTIRSIARVATSRCFFTRRYSNHRQLGISMIMTIFYASA